MKEMLIIMASLMSKEQIIEKLQESIDELKEAQLLCNDKEIETKTHNLVISCHLLTMHVVSDDKGLEGALKTIKDMNEIEKNNNFFKTANN
jgi:hypothetical protein